jgi:hypothetical protein
MTQGSRCLRRSGPVRPGPGLLHSPGQAASISAPVAQLFAAMPLAPVAQPSPLRLNSGGRRASPTSHWSWVSSRAACRRAGSPARIATVVLVGCSGAGSGWRCRAWIAGCTVYLGGPATVGAGPLMCADSWAVTAWQCGGSPAPRGCASLGVTGLSAANQPPISKAPLRLLSRPS